jgi:putative ABC transport system permease protein
MTTTEEQLITVSPIGILITMVPLLLVAWASAAMGLGIESPILVGTVRALIQLSILGLILDPIFVWGIELWWLVPGYCGIMILLASYESSVRSKYYLEGQFLMVLVPMTLTIVGVSAFAFGVVLRPKPLWDPQYVIPIVGMLLGNCINGVSLALNSILTSLMESSREIELLLSFGANSYEASSRLCRDAVRTGSMPQLNGMAIIGIISIPGILKNIMTEGG